MTTTMKSFDMTAQTFAGLEDVLISELRSMGATDIEKGSRAVMFKGTKEVLYRVNLCSRTAIRVLVPIRTFDAPDEQTFYDEIKKMQWEDLITVNESIAVDAITALSTMTHSQYIALKAKDGIVDRFRENGGSRPSVNTRVPDLAVHIRLHKNECTVSLDSTGMPLYKRGYRTEGALAPINEALAAGLLLLTGWDKREPLMDPMCGSGTFSVEAALIAKNMPPGFLRKDYVFMHWKKFLSFDVRLWDKVRDEAFAKRAHRLNVDIHTSDNDPEALEMARKSVELANLSHELKPVLVPFDQTLPLPGKGMIILNPPYGERITVEDLNGLYKSIGDHLKKKFPGYVCWILTSNEEATKHIGLHATKKIKVFNGPLECSFMRFEMYEGSKKKKYSKAAETDQP